MTEREQIDHFADELDKLVHRSSEEYDMSYAAMVGCLQFKIHVLCNEAEERKDEV